MYSGWISAIRGFLYFIGTVDADGRYNYQIVRNYQVAYLQILFQVFNLFPLYRAFSSVLQDTYGEGLFFASGRRGVIERDVTISISPKGAFYLHRKACLLMHSYYEVGNGARLTVGEDAFINRNAQIVCMHEITLSGHIALGTGISMFDHDHCYHADCVQNWKESKQGCIRVERDVWIGANAILLRGCNIGHNSVIAAGVIVRESIPANTLLYLDRKSYSFRSISSANKGDSQ